MSADFFLDHIVPAVVVMAGWFYVRRKVQDGHVKIVPNLSAFDSTLLPVLFGVLLGPFITLPVWPCALAFVLVCVALGIFWPLDRKIRLLFVLAGSGLFLTAFGGHLFLSAHPPNVLWPTVVLISGLLTAVICFALLKRLVGK